jgi:hypothetical protein
MEKMKQKELIIEFIKEFGSIAPAKMSGKIYKNTMFGSESSKRCRELRDEEKLVSEPDGKFERFFLKQGEQKLFDLPEEPRSPSVIF